MPTKQQMVEQARQLVRDVFPHVNEQASCLYSAWAIITVARRHGIRLCLQAGSGSWVRTHEDVDDQCFGYSDVDLTPEKVELALLNGMLPEMHVWAGDPVRQELVDITTKWFPAQCADLQGGRGWPAKKPPDFLWATRDHPDAEGAYYMPSMLATQCADLLLCRALMEAQNQRRTG